MSDKDVRDQAQPASTRYWRPNPPSANLARRTCGWLLGLGVFALVLFSVLGENGLGEYLRLRGQRDGLERDLDQLAAETAQLEDRIKALRTEPLALEKLARERYNMRREEEQVILLVPGSEQKSADP